MSSELEQLASWGRQWRDAAGSFAFLCGIQLDEQELKSALRLIRACRCRLDKSEDTRFALATIAVNFAYLRDPPDDDQGLRVSLTREIFDNSFHEKTWEDYLGAPIERAFADWLGRPPKPGPYRYVGVILEHAAIRHSGVPGFARMVADLARDPGWAHLNSIEHSDLQTKIKKHFSEHSYPARFLASAQGHQLLRQTCRDLSFYLDGLVCDLDDFKGYRPGFLEQILKEVLDPIRPKPRARPALDVEMPRLQLSDGQLFLCFDHVAVSKGLFTCDQYSGRILPPRLTVGEDIARLDRYSGNWQCGQGEIEWRAEGWKAPAGSWALFDENGWFVAAREHQQPCVPPGQYYLVSDSRIALSEEIVTASYGPLQLEGLDFASFIVSSVALYAGATLPPGLQVGQRTVKTPTLRPTGSAEWTRYTNLDAIWAGTEPILRIEPWTKEHAQRHLVVLEVAGRPKRVRVPVLPDGAVVAELQTLSHPCIGRIWLQSSGSVQETCCPPPRLTFAIWPRIDLIPPAGLYSDSETPEVSVRVSCPSDARVVSPDETVREERGRYLATPNTSVAVLEVQVAGQRVTAHLPIYRARFRWQDELKSNIHLAPETLEAEHKAYLKNHDSRSLMLFALPEETATLWLRPCVPDRTRVKTLVREIGPSGRAQVQVSEILDPLRSCRCSLAEFEVSTTGQPIATGTWYVDSTILMDELGQFENIASVPPDLQPVLQCLMDIRQGHRPSVLTPASIYPRSLSRLVALWCCAAECLDGWPAGEAFWQQLEADAVNRLTQLRQLIDEIPILGVPEFSVTAASKLRDTWRAVSPATVLADLGLSLQRWQDRLKNLEGLLYSAADTDKIVREWAEAVREDRQPSARAPEQLTSATQYYRWAEKSSPQYVYEAAQILSRLSDPVDPPWDDAATILRALIFLRCGGIRSFLRLYGKRHWQGRMELAWRQLGIIVANLRGKPQTAGRMIDALGIRELSPRSDDGLLADWLLETAVDRQEQGCWLTAWLKWRHSDMMHGSADQSEVYYQRLLSLRDSIPGRHDGPGIQQEIDNRTAGVWNDE